MGVVRGFGVGKLDYPRSVCPDTHLGPIREVGGSLQQVLQPRDAATDKLTKPLAAREVPVKLG